MGAPHAPPPPQEEKECRDHSTDSEDIDPQTAPDRQGDWTHSGGMRIGARGAEASYIMGGGPIGTLSRNKRGTVMLGEWKMLGRLVNPVRARWKLPSDGTGCVWTRKDPLPVEAYQTPVDRIPVSGRPLREGPSGDDVERVTERWLAARLLKESKRSPQAPPQSLGVPAGGGALGDPEHMDLADEHTPPETSEEKPPRRLQVSLSNRPLLLSRNWKRLWLS